MALSHHLARVKDEQMWKALVVLLEDVPDVQKEPGLGAQTRQNVAALPNFRRSVGILRPNQVGLQEIPCAV